MRPPASETAVGMGAYLTATPGIGGRLRAEVDDFVVIERGDGPPRHADGRLSAARIRLRNWETNRFVSAAASQLRVNPGKVAFHGMKDKRAITEQWFTFPCPPDRLERLHLDDVKIVAHHRTHERAYAGGHDGNAFVIRIRDHKGEPATVEDTLHAIRQEGGVPHYFGPQRFGGRIRPVTHHIGRAIVAGDLEEAVRLFLGQPVAAEGEAIHAARSVYERTRDAAATLDVLPDRLDLERRMLERLAARPGDWRHALFALPRNLLQLFVHAWQSFLFNDGLTARLAAGLGLRTAHVGDLVQADGEDAAHAVTAANQARVQHEIDAGRASPTGPLPGTAGTLAGGEPGAIEERVLAAHGVELDAFRCTQLPEVASQGRRRVVLQRVDGLDVAWTDGDPVLSFALGRGAYATVVLREVMKAELD